MNGGADSSEEATMTRSNAIARLLVAGLLAAAAATATGQTMVTDGVLTDPSGRSLYTSAAEPIGKSYCDGACLSMWTPYAAPADAKPQGDLSLIKRDDGTLQWAWKGKALYRWWDDKKPGDKGGDGLRGGNWKVVRP